MLTSKDGKPFGFFPLTDLPPGVWRNGTEYQSKNRWRDANLVRFFSGTIRPWLGWNAHSASAVTGKARALLPWQDPVNLLWIGVLTESHVYVYSRSGAQTDITPSGLTVGRPDAILTAGYGGGTYGTGTYGTARGGSTTLQDATVWTPDTLEGLLVAVNSDDGKLYSWDNNTAHLMTQPSGSPTNNSACFVTNEGFVFVLGAGGNPRKVQWPDQDSLTDWTPSDTNQAGSYSIATPGRLMCGCRLASANLIFASTDVHLATYAGIPDKYDFEQVGAGCGIISRAAFAKGEAFVAWMGLSGWWKYDGTVTPIASTIQDDVFNNLNVLQRSKVWALHNPIHGTMIWFYPSNAGTEIDSFAEWNYRENHWTNGKLGRTCGYEAGVFQWPLMVDTAGIVQQHENGLSYSGGTTPYLETGPLELGSGDLVYDIVEIEPDASNLGDVTVTIYSKLHSTGTDAVSPAYTLTNPTSVRPLGGREYRLRFTSAANTNWRIGPGTRLNIRPAGAR